MPDVERPGRSLAHFARVPLFCDEHASRLRVSTDSFVRELLGDHAVVLRGPRSCRVKRPAWGFYHQSEDPSISPTESEVHAADAMLALGASSSSSSPPQAPPPHPLAKRVGSRDAKRPRLAAREEVGPRPRGQERWEGEEAPCQQRQLRAPVPVGPPAPCPSTSTSSANVPQVLNLVAALQKMAPNGIKAASQLGLGQLPQFPIRPPEPQKHTLQVPAAEGGVPMPPLFLSSRAAGKGTSPSSQGLPLAMFGCVLNPQAKGPQGQAVPNPSLNPAPPAGASPPVVMLPPWGLGGLHPALQHAAVRPELKGEIEKLLGQNAPVLPVPLFPASTSSAPPAPQIPLLRGLPLPNLASQVPLPINVPVQLTARGPSPRNAKEPQGGRTRGVDAATAQVVANYASLTQFLAALSSLKQNS